MFRPTVALIGLTYASSAGAYDLSKAMSGMPEANITGTANIYVAERCIVMIDSISAPIVYRTPDRPNESLIYAGRDGGSPIVYKLERLGEGVRVLIYNGLKWRKAIADCANTK
jgi:hypothetical protein